MEEVVADDDERIIAQFFSAEGVSAGPQIDLPLNTTQEQLQLLINDFLANEEKLPYSFFVNEEEVVSSLENVLSALQAKKETTSKEDVLRIVYQPQAVFRVRTVTRCTSSLEGHTEAVIVVRFSPDGKQLATGSGDSTIRIWDLNTETPKFTCKGHTNWVLCLEWSPDGRKIASGGKDSKIFLWSPTSGKRLTRPLKKHIKWINAISWEPFHKDGECKRLASASKDGTVKIWDAIRGTCLRSIGVHSLSVTCVKWGGEGLIYSSSQDRTVKVFTPEGKIVRILKGHAHWVNTLALNTDYVIRCGAFDYKCTEYDSVADAQEAALKRYMEVKGEGGEILASGSDDYTIFLWKPSESKNSIIRMTGHQQAINLIVFSPDGRLLASGAFDKSIKLWDGKTGKFICSLRGHIGAVYQVCWSADSRMLCSGSKDSTLKVWSLKTKKMAIELPGHADEVYTVDWSPDGSAVASGAKDCLLRIWRY